MEVIDRSETMQARSLELKREGRSIAFVPTMGFLHEGHLSLMDIARSRAEILVVSIFVNPTQFGANEDLDQYPRDLRRDLGLCEDRGVDIVFAPESTVMYAEDASCWVDEEGLSKGLCGATRPGHFRGVCTVVAKLFNLVQPNLAVFGEKDAQQLRIIRRMVRDLNFPIEIVGGAIVREADGLALSSRNRYLSAEEREQALCLQRALKRAEQLFEKGEKNAAKIERQIFEIVDAEPLAEIDYIALVDESTLIPVSQIESATLVALAVDFNGTRLIDNKVLGCEKKRTA